MATKTLPIRMLEEYRELLDSLKKEEKWSHSEVIHAALHRFFALTVIEQRNEVRNYRLQKVEDASR